MCGIAGHFGTRPPDDAQVAACLALMRRRGPDAEATVSRTTGGRTATLLHSRLSIIDLDARADQPLERDGCAIVFNGEIYNFQALRADAEARGASFSTRSDTEVLAEALAREGPEALDRMEGMWAFAFHDGRDGSLTLSRDRFGEKPLFVHEDERGVWFGSEVKFLAALSGKRFEPDLGQVRRYLVQGYKALYKGGATFFEGVREVRPATVLRYGPGGEREERRYWAPAYAPNESMTYEQAVAGARERLVEAVRLRLVADVPIAFCLSGGVDSNALVAIARRVHGQRVHGFTIVSADARYDEEHLVDLAVGRLGLEHTKVPTDTSRFLERLRELVKYHDGPVHTISDYCKALLFERIHEAGYKVALTGAGADEIFSGYYDHHLWYMAEVRADEPRFQAYLAAWREHVASVVRNPFLSDPERFVREPGFRDHIFLHADLFAECLVEPFDETFTETSYTTDRLRGRMMNEMFHEAVPPILHDDDLDAMVSSVENRSPFLDRALFEFVYTVPTRHLMRDGYAKALLRDAVAGIVPDEIRLEHRKVGFNAPIEEFLDLSDPAVRKEILRPSPIYDIVRREKIEALLDRKQLPNSESKFLFYFLSAKMFLETFGTERDAP